MEFVCITHDAATNNEMKLIAQTVGARRSTKPKQFVFQISQTLSEQHSDVGPFASTRLGFKVKWYKEKPQDKGPRILKRW